jgi:hypothetical protein
VNSERILALWSVRSITGLGGWGTPVICNDKLSFIPLLLQTCTCVCSCKQKAVRSGVLEILLWNTTTKWGYTARLRLRSSLNLLLIPFTSASPPFAAGGWRIFDNQDNSRLQSVTKWSHCEHCVQGGSTALLHEDKQNEGPRTKGQTAMHHETHVVQKRQLCSWGDTGDLPSPVSLP